MLWLKPFQGSTWCPCGKWRPRNVDCKVSDVVRTQEWDGGGTVCPLFQITLDPPHPGSGGLIPPWCFPTFWGWCFLPFLFFHTQLFPLLSANKPTLSEGNGEKALVSSFLFFFSLVIRVSWGTGPWRGSRTEGKLEPKSPRTLKDADLLIIVNNHTAPTLNHSYTSHLEQTHAVKNEDFHRREIKNRYSVSRDVTLEVFINTSTKCKLFLMHFQQALDFC